ncbi:hypothetical protein SAMN02910358_01160 [Lachnospiraceae bacterium XBB1006]|nr:hypothetical protein SAMN02910358_01160 [Lachnospiraceae bacterium XBB1006]
MQNGLLVSHVMEKRKELNIPYQNLLVGCAKEWIIERLVTREDEMLHFYLKRASQIGVKAYRCKNARQLYACVVNFSQEENALEQFLYCTFENVFLEREKDGLSVLIKVPFDKVLVDIRLHLSFCDAKKAQSYTKTISLLYEEGKELEIPCFYPEAEIVEIFCEAYEKMDLFTDMEAIEVVYEYAKTRNMNGKYLTFFLEENLKKSGHTLTAEEMRLFEQAIRGKALRSRYKGYLRNQKRKDPDYEEVIRVLDKLFKPVLQAISRHEIFFGDWMAEVERFL